MLNVQSRHLPVPAAQAAAVLDEVIALWPAPPWPVLKLDRGLTVGSRGGHGPIRYRVTVREADRIRFEFDPRIGLVGYHELRIEAATAEATTETAATARAAKGTETATTAEATKGTTASAAAARTATRGTVETAATAAAARGGTATERGTASGEPTATGKTSSRIVDTLAARAQGRMRLLWPVMFRWLHEDLMQDLFDNVELRLTGRLEGPAATHRPLTRLLIDRPAAAGPSERPAAGDQRPQIPQP